jgi:hypothetical protein
LAATIIEGDSSDDGLDVVMVCGGPGRGVTVNDEAGLRMSRVKSRLSTKNATAGAHKSNRNPTCCRPGNGTMTTSAEKKTKSWAVRLPMNLKLKDLDGCTLDSDEKILVIRGVSYQLMATDQSVAATTVVCALETKKKQDGDDDSSSDSDDDDDDSSNSSGKKKKSKKATTKKRKSSTKKKKKVKHADRELLAR